jgi:hypothetical protein
MKTKDKLCKLLTDAGLNQDDTAGQGKLLLQMAVRASQRYYDDFETMYQLVADLQAVGRHDLAKRVMNGEWDATKEESEESSACRGRLRGRRPRKGAPLG